MEYTVNLGKESIKKIGDAISGRVEIEPLEVTENGEYTAPSGKAYSPVSVNVEGNDCVVTTASISSDENYNRTYSFEVPFAPKHFVIYYGANFAAPTKNILKEGSLLQGGLFQ